MTQTELLSGGGKPRLVDRRPGGHCFVCSVHGFYKKATENTAQGCGSASIPGQRPRDVLSPDPWPGPQGPSSHSMSPE